MHKPRKIPKCTKRKYTYRVQAEQARDHLRKVEAGKPNCQNINVYFCKRCGGYHVGHTPWHKRPDSNIRQSWEQSITNPPNSSQQTQ